MIALGVFVLVIVGLASLAVVFRGGESVSIDLQWFTVNTTAGFVFLAGAVALALVAFGTSLLWEGLKRDRKRRKETKSLRSRAEANEESASTGGSSEEPGHVTGERSGPDDHTAPRDR